MLASARCSHAHQTCAHKVSRSQSYKNHGPQRMQSNAILSYSQAHPVRNSVPGRLRVCCIATVDKPSVTGAWSPDCVQFARQQYLRNSWQGHHDLEHPTEGRLFVKRSHSFSHGFNEQCVLGLIRHLQTAGIVPHLYGVFEVRLPAYAMPLLLGGNYLLAVDAQPWQKTV